VDEKSLQLVKVMREQLGETSASRTVDAVAAAGSLGMYPGTLDRSLHELIQAGYVEESANPRTDHAGDVPDYLRGYICGRQRLAPVLNRARVLLSP
jgi:hypothetical protein